MEHKINEKRVVESVTITLTVGELEVLKESMGNFSDGYQLYVSLKKLLDEVKGA